MGDNNFDWKWSVAAGRAGGLLCLWNTNQFKIRDSFVGLGFIILRGELGSERQDCVLVNVYALCNAEEKPRLWGELEQWRQVSTSQMWCVAGDFNAVRSLEERKGLVDGNLYGVRESDDFNAFISTVELFDIPLLRKHFTWYQSNGKAMSRLDRFIVSHEWLLAWPGWVQLALDMEFSDHCSLRLKCVVADWGPKPFGTLNCWFDDPKFKAFVEAAW